MRDPAFRKTILGYCDPLTVEAGERLRLFVSCYTPGHFRCDLVRLICGDCRANGAGFQEQAVPWNLAGEYPGREQALVPGSYVELPELPTLREFTFCCVVYPTRPGRTQCLADFGALKLLTVAGCLAVQNCAERVSLSRPLRARHWYSVACSVSRERAVLELAARPLRPSVVDAVTLVPEAARFDLELQAEGYALQRLAADRERKACYDGKLEAPRLFGAALDAADAAEGAANPDAADAPEPIAAWDFAREIAGERVVDVGPGGFHGRTVQHPTRAVKGWRWDGSTQRWTETSEQYAAIHFHSTDLADAEWDADLAWTVAGELRSGVYAFRLRHDGTEDHVPFFVRPAPHHERRPVAFLAPTATYMAYANQRLFLSGGIFGDGEAHDANAAFLRDHPEVGLSLYERHGDRSGVHVSSRLRPILNLKPKGEMWAFNADTNILAWLEHLAQPFDVVTDEDLHTRGLETLAPYRAVVTGTHPEYYSTPMRDGLEAYLQRGGRLMYLGGNGFYWRIAYRGARGEAIEVRRAEDGTRAWIAEPGEYYHAWSGEYGGLWRRLGRPPNQLVGVGFAAQGFDGSSYYRRQPDSFSPRAAFIFDGVEAQEILGDFGSIGGGAAGEEIDRWDAALGSPEHALILARSERHKPGMLRTKEEFLSTVPPFEDPKVRADMVFFETPDGGAVFSTGSIAYAGALAHNDYRNDICRLTTNVLRRMLHPDPFEPPQR